MQSMRNCLLFLSLVACWIFSYGEGVENKDTTLLQRYLFKVEMPKGYLSGVMLVSERSDAIVGSLINEFGVSAGSFIYSKQTKKLKLVDVISFLNKWYIKRILSSDLKLSIETLYNIPYKPPKNYLIKRENNRLLIENQKRNIKYEFIPIADCEEQDIN